MMKLHRTKIFSVSSLILHLLLLTLSPASSETSLAATFQAQASPHFIVINANGRVDNEWRRRLEDRRLHSLCLNCLKTSAR